MMMTSTCLAQMKRYRHGDACDDNTCCPLVDTRCLCVSQEDAEAAKLKEQRLAEYAAKKAKSTSSLVNQWQHCSLFAVF